MQRAQRLGQRPVHQGRIVTITQDTVQLPNGRTVDYDVVRHPGAAAIVPVDARGNVLLVRQLRYAVNEWIVEVPAGKLDDHEQPLACARRELEEETGHIAARWTPMGSILTTPGFCDERIHLFLATELTATRQALEPDELLELEPTPLQEAIEHAAEGTIEDAKTVIALLRAQHYLTKLQSP